MITCFFTNPRGTAWLDKFLKNVELWVYQSDKTWPTEQSTDWSIITTRPMIQSFGIFHLKKWLLMICPQLLILSLEIKANLSIMSVTRKVRKTLTKKPYSFYRRNDCSNRIKWTTQVASRVRQFFNFISLNVWTPLIRIICIDKPTGTCGLHQSSKSTPDSHNCPFLAHFPHSIWQQRLWPNSALDWRNFETVLYGRRHPMRQGKNNFVNRN